MGSSAEKLDNIMSKINSDIGGKNNLLKKASDDTLNTKWISSGLLSFDLATQPHQGAGGFPLGKIIEVYGPSGSGKTSLALSLIGQAQSKGHNCMLLDNENGLDPVYAMNMGVDIDDLVLSQDNEGERSLDAIEALIYSNELDVIVVDSVAGLATKEELTKNMDDKQMGDRARLWSKAMRKLSSALNKFKCTLILINQIRMDLNVKFGNPEVTPGGKAIKFFSDMRVDVRARDTFSEGRGDDKFIKGHKIRYRIIKNKVGTAWGVGFADLYYDTGFDKTKDLLNAAEEEEIIDKSGGWRTYIPLGVKEDEDDKIIKENGTDNFIEALNGLENPELMKKEIRKRILGTVEEPLYYNNDDNEKKTKEED